MKMLCFFRYYSFRCNEYVRYLVSADTQEEAQAEVEQALDGMGFRLEAAAFVCRTDNSVYKEI